MQVALEPTQSEAQAAAARVVMKRRRLAPGKFPHRQKRCLGRLLGKQWRAGFKGQGKNVEFPSSNSHLFKDSRMPPGIPFQLPGGKGQIPWESREFLHLTRQKDATWHWEQAKTTCALPLPEEKYRELGSERGSEGVGKGEGEGGSGAVGGAARSPNLLLSPPLLRPPTHFHQRRAMVGGVCHPAFWCNSSLPSPFFLSLDSLFPLPFFFFL